jgi:hypothetical protein
MRKRYLNSACYSVLRPYSRRSTHRGRRFSYFSRVLIRPLLRGLSSIKAIKDTLRRRSFGTIVALKQNFQYHYYP